MTENLLFSQWVFGSFFPCYYAWHDLVYKLVRFYQPESRHQYDTTRATLTVFSVSIQHLIFKVNDPNEDDSDCCIHTTFCNFRRRSALFLRLWSRSTEFKGSKSVTPALPLSRELETKSRRSRCTFKAKVFAPKWQYDRIPAGVPRGAAWPAHIHRMIVPKIPLPLSPQSKWYRKYLRFWFGLIYWPSLVSMIDLRIRSWQFSSTLIFFCIPVPFWQPYPISPTSMFIRRTIPPCCTSYQKYICHSFATFCAQRFKLKNHT